MNKAVLIDTGPLVAVMSGNDSEHRRCVEALKHLAPPLNTCWPVITEACWLLRTQPAAIQNLLGSFQDGLLNMLPLASEDIEPIAKLMQRYRQLGAQLADVALVHLANRERINTVFTLDQRDFTVYRHHDTRRFHLLP